MHYLPSLLISIVVLIYAALTADAQRKCAQGAKPNATEQSMLKYVNVTMLILASAAVLYFGYCAFVPDADKKLASYF